MKQYYIATLEIVVDDKDADYSVPIIDPITEKIFNNEMDIIGLIRLTHERQKQRPSFKVRNGTLKKTCTGSVRLCYEILCQKATI